jgi:A/G-specific adenine glycosylase
VLVSELMLQQTQVSRVVAKYAPFLRAFPSLRALANASVGDVCLAWNGLGYNRRALALRETARVVVSRFRGRLPRTVTELTKLPGIGQATASAILVYAFGIPLPFIETNIRRVFLHHFFPGELRVPDSRIMPLVEKTLDRANPSDWYYALMDYGSLLGRSTANPNRRSAHYKRQSAFGGSVRQLRGRVLAVMLELGEASRAGITRALGTQDPRLEGVLERLQIEGFLSRPGRRYQLR